MNDKSSSTQEISAAGETVLSIRLWVPVLSDLPDELVWKSSVPAVSIAVDIIQASEGASITTDGNLLVSKFSSMQAAILAAKRIQWAVSGCSEDGKSENGKASILIQSAAYSQSQADSLSYALAHASPGQILLTEASCKWLENLPGLVMLPASHGMRELQWNSAGSESATAADDRALDELIRQRGLDVPGPARRVAIPALEPMPVTSAASEPDAASFIWDEEPAGKFYDAWLSRLLAMPRWQKYGAAGIALVAVIAFFLMFFHSKAPVQSQEQVSALRQPAQPQPQEVQLRSSGPTGNPPAVTPEPQKQETKGPAQDKRKEAHNTPHSSSPPVKQSMGSCVLNTNDVSVALGLADVSFQNRQYKDAERKYRSVLACQPDNARALSGAERSRSSLQLQQSASKP